MEKGFFYGMMLLLWIAFILVLKIKRFSLRHLFMWITYSLYSLTYENLFGEVFHLYYYIYPEDSLVYILLASFLLYPLYIILYLFFLPCGRKVIWYSAGWIIVMQFFEIVSLYTRTVVLTGWEIIPWSPVTYIVSYFLVYIYNGYLQRAIPDL